MGEKIKIKDIEGDADELIKIFMASDCELSDYLQVHKYKIPTWIFIILILLFVISICALWILPAIYVIWHKILIVLTVVFGGILLVLLHYHLNNTFVSLISAFILSVLFLMSLNVLTPEQAGQKIQDRIENHLENSN